MCCLYNVVCNTCQDTIDPEIRQEHTKPGGTKGSHYIGMTSTSLHNMQKDHREAYNGKKANNPLHKHDLDKHGGSKKTYRVIYIIKERGILSLAMGEEIMVERKLFGTSMNDREEKGRGTGLVWIEAVVI